MTKRTLFLPPTLLLLAAAACSGTDDGDPSGPEAESRYSACLEAQSKAVIAARAVSDPLADAKRGPFSAALLATEPARIADAVRSGLKASMHQQLEAQRAQQIASLRCESLRPTPPEGGYAQSADAGAAGYSAAPSADKSGGASEVSTTNNQVAGVDEADFVKNDDKYIYVANGSSFRVIEAWPADTAHEIANVDVPGAARKLFVQGDRALVYSATTKPSSSSSPYYGGPYYGGAGGECTYGQSGCVPSGDGTETEISIFDISNRAAPKLVRSIHSSSSLIAARRIGNTVHTVLGQPTMQPDLSLEYYASESWKTEAGVNATYDAMLARNDAKIDAIDAGNVLPTWTDSAGRAPELCMFQSSMPDGQAMTSVLSLDLLSDPSLKVASVLSRPGWVYASEGALYMAVPHEQISGWGWYEGVSDDELSTVHKFSLGSSPLSTAYVGSGIVKGRVLSELAMDEADGNLRVATTTGHLPDPAAHNTISVLEDQAGKLAVVGQIDHIAPGEDIRSVRFDGRRGYIVTFKKTDPLFVYDLADAHAPKELGELEIPGFSTYMHMMDATHLLTIGYDAADQGDFAWFTGVILQIFDVSNPTDPKLVHKETIGTRGTSSEALTNHLAFNYFAPKNLLALPMTICEGGNRNGGYGTEMTFSGLMVYDTTVADGFHLRGKVAHPNSINGDSQNGYGYYDTGCYNWWANATSEVKRSIFMDDWVFSISTTRIKVNNLAALSTDVKELSIE